MVIQGMAMPKAANERTAGLEIPFSTMAVGDAHKVVMDGVGSKNPYGLIKQRVFRASKGAAKFVTRRIDGETFVFRTD